MPRRRRLSPGQSYGGSGGGIDVGGILSSIFGGVEANPDALTTQGPPQVAGGPGAGGELFRPKTIFDRNAARQMNANYFQGQLEEENAMNRDLSYLGKETPLLADRAKLLGGVNNQNTLQLLEQRIPIDTKANQASADITRKTTEQEQIGRMLTQLGLMPSRAGEYDARIGPQQLDRLSAEALSGTQAANTAGTENRIKERIMTKTEPFNVAGAGQSAQQSFKRSFNANALENQLGQNAQYEADNYIRNRETEHLGQRLQPLGNAIFDIATRSPIMQYTPMMQFQQQQVPAAPATSGGQIIDVDGVKVRVPAGQPQPVELPQTTATELINNTPEARSLAQPMVTPQNPPLPIGPQREPYPGEQALRGAGSTISNSVTQGIPNDLKALLMRIVSPYYRPAPAQPRNK